MIFICFTAGVGRSTCSSKTADSWYLYTSHLDICVIKEKLNPNQTLEILMTQLNPNVMKIFTKEQSTNQLFKLLKYYKIIISYYLVKCNLKQIYIILGFWNIRIITQYDN